MLALVQANTRRARRESSCRERVVLVLIPFLSLQRSTVSSHARPKTLLQKSDVS